MPRCSAVRKPGPRPREPGACKPDTWRYEWDALNRLVACTTPDGTRWVYTYDALGRRTSKQRLGGDSETPVEVVYFTWDGTRLAEEHSTATGVTSTWEDDGHITLAQYERKHLTSEEVDSRFFAIATDLAGTPTELISETGEIAWQACATVWGTPVGTAAPPRTRPCGTRASTPTPRPASTTTSTATTTPTHSSAPELDRCKLQYLHFDERGTSATLGLSTGVLPDHPWREWEAKPFNSVTFYLVCEEITEVALNGRGIPTPTLELAAAAAGVRGGGG